MSALTKWMDKTLYSGFGNNWDDEIFRTAVKELIDSDSSCLDYGAGRGNVKQMNFLGMAKFVAGVDPERGVLENPNLNDAKLLDMANNVIPYPDNSFDVVFSDNVMEHVQVPAVVFKEILRVLKPGGYFLAKTPNKWHYMPVIARWTPTWFHRFYNRIRGREAIDTFPTAYKCNSKKVVEDLSRESGFGVKEIRFIEGRPEYLRLTFPTYLIGCIYERIVNSTAFLTRFRCVMIFILRKNP